MPLEETVSVDQSVLDDLTTGLNHFVFKDWAGPAVPVWVFLPDNVDRTTAPVMVMMHGAKRGAARYLAAWDEVATAHGFIVIAPEFNREDFPGSRSYNRGNRIDRETGEVNDPALWTFSAIEPIFDEVVGKLGGVQTHYTLYGHSAGSQFTHRFMYFKPDARVSRYLPANAGWYTFPDLDVPYPEGLGGTGLTDEDLKRILEKDVVILLGDADNDPDHDSLRRGALVDFQGPHRFARGLNFFNTGKAEAERLGADFGWRVRIFEDVAHSNAAIAAAAGDLVE